MVTKNIGYPNGDWRNATGRALGVDLRAEAAGALDALAWHYQRQFGKPLAASEGMRSIAMQNYYWDRYINRRPGWTVAAQPGTSNHGWGLAVDLAWPITSSATAEHAWVAATAPLFGWEWTGRNFGEPWHFDFTGINLTASQVAEYVSRGTNTSLIQEEGFLMALNETAQKAVHDSLVNTSGGYYYKTDAIIKIAQRLEKKVDDVLAGRIRYPGAPYYMATAIVNAVREEQGKEPVEVDEAALGKSIADNLTPVIQAAIAEGAVTGSTAAEIADELARRLEA
ncbi:hypothetical protein GCM10011490_24420 [Pseudoclavibacter endophyticus]|nr:M15 family metallopeptidase [Pseudoclavibacter endophyticus]GGA72757.1 hypothetical protein GCM10011490_24420 [Pseudoclavibacter endophyticus]